jgi:glutamate-1-semialdehyde aminotransferase
MTIASANDTLDHLMGNPQIYQELEEKGDFLRSAFNEFTAHKGYPAAMTGVGSMW